MRQRRAAQNLAEVRGINLPPDLLAKVHLAALFTNTRSVTELVARATQVYVEKTAEETSALLRVICTFWPQIREYRPYLTRLAAPCPPVVIKGKTFTHEQASKFNAIYADIRSHMKARGVTLADAAFDSLLDEICTFATEHKILAPTGLRPSPSTVKFHLRA